MADKQEERKTWVVGRRGSYTTGWPIYEDGALVYWLGSTPREATAHQIVDDHNTRPELEARIAELEWEKQHLLGVLEIVREGAESAEAEVARLREALGALVSTFEGVEVETVIYVSKDHWRCRNCELDLTLVGEFCGARSLFEGHHSMCHVGIEAQAVREAKAALSPTPQEEAK